MTGQHTAVLNACLVGPIHTYVSSSCGLNWGCFGRSSGGEILNHGVGSSLAANCISENNSGIVYAVTGVCHQAANRILWPAAIDVAGAGGYAQSVFTFSKFGRSLAGIGQAWDSLRERCSRMIEEGSKKELDSSNQHHPGYLERAGLGSRHTRYSTMGSNQHDGEDERLNELTNLIIQATGSRLDDAIFASVANAQKELRDKQATLAQALVENDITKGDYISALQRAVSECNLQVQQAIGQERFQQVFRGVDQLTDIVDLDRFFGPGGLPGKR